MYANKRDEKGMWVKGIPGGPGRPKGSISIITRLKQKFKEDPEGFDEFIERYKNNPKNERHITEMIDGKPAQAIDHTTGGEPIQINLAGEIANRDDKTTQSTE